MKKKIVFLTGAGISVESGLSTFRDANGLWDQYKVEEVATHNAWLKSPNFVNKFYNMLRLKYGDVQPNEAHKLIAELENDYDVTVITQNVDNLHEKGGSTNIIHLHGDIMTMCSEKDVENTEYHISLPHEGFGKSGFEVPEDYKAGDGSLLRPYIVFFEEPVPNIEKAVDIVSQADIFVVVGTSLNVYPAANLINYVDIMSPIFVIDPNPVDCPWKFTHIQDTASSGIKNLVARLKCL